MSFISEKVKQTIIESGRAALHATKPDEFEYYACTFELMDSHLDTEEVFHFPIMPTAMSINSQFPVNIKKSGRGYLVQTSDTFVGKSISLNGSFGRKFQTLFHTSTNSSGILSKNLKLRTGYGATKLMESMIDKIRVPDPYGNPRLFVVHNFAFGLSVVAEVLSASVSQSMENNMMWNYSIEMKAVADYDKLRPKQSKRDLANLLKANVGQRTVNNFLANITPGSLIRAIGK